MKKAIIISLLFLYAFSSTELRELFKLPSLVEHYGEHRAANSAISFFDFLSLHYLDVEKHGAENSKDKSLPFKTHEHCNTFLAQSPNVPGSAISITPAESFVTRNYFPTREFSYTSFQVNIWQPPKSA